MFIRAVVFIRINTVEACFVIYFALLHFELMVWKEQRPSDCVC